jgi:hypothetical protein
MRRDPSDDEPLAAGRLRQLAERDRQRLLRVAQRPLAPSVGDVYALPLPVAGPELWCVVSVVGDRAKLLAVDSRPFFAPSDLWVTTPAGDRCLRRQHPLQVPLVRLDPGARVDHWGEALSWGLGEEVAPDGDFEEPEERMWRRAVRRASQTLALWLTDRVLELDPTELEPEVDAEGDGRSIEGASQVGAARARWTRLAAAPGRVIGTLHRLEMVRRFGVRALELFVATGELRLLVSLRGLAFAFRGEAAASPPAITWMSAVGGSTAGGWGEAEDGSWRCVHVHDLCAQGTLIRVDAAAPFHIRILGANAWGAE